jgi:hypothetical protein
VTLSTLQRQSFRGIGEVWTTLFAVAVVPLLISSVVAAVVTCFYFACVRKERDQT